MVPVFVRASTVVLVRRTPTTVLLYEYRGGGQRMNGVWTIFETGALFVSWRDFVTFVRGGLLDRWEDTA